MTCALLRRLVVKRIYVNYYGHVLSIESVGPIHINPNNSTLTVVNTPQVSNTISKVEA